ncbi:MAG TPA: lycopene cyclase domain-containing protein [Bacteroidia bacterium]|nr:lycopene cyclase domain-containing protein [Bacteroidia bacterium]
MKYLYLLLNIGFVLFPLVFTFHSKIKFYRKWKYLLPAILIMAALFLIWDYLFTEWRIWTFNEDYITGIKFYGLPLEEILLYLCIPYSCLFIYETLIIYNVKNYLRRARLVSWVIITGLIVALFFTYNYLYTGVSFLLAIAYLFQLVVIHRVKWLGRFYMGYIASLVPFLIFNGALTALPVVIYNDTEIMGIRLLTVPLENLAHFFLVLLVTTALYERFHGRYKPIVDEDEAVIDHADIQAPDTLQQ